MNAHIDLQAVWNENKGEVQLFTGDFRIGLPPAACEQLEKDLAAARQVAERGRAMADCNPNYIRSADTGLHNPMWNKDDGVILHSQDSQDIAAWGGDAVASDGA